MFDIDSLAYQNKFRNFPPIAKFLIVFSFLVLSLFSKSATFSLLVAILAIFLLIYSNNFKIFNFFKFICASTLSLFLLSALIIIIITPSSSFFEFEFFNLNLKVGKEALNTAILVLAKTAAGIFLMLLFSFSTPSVDLFASLKQINFPPIISELAILIYRYSFVILEQFFQMFYAADSRLGFSDLKKSISSISIIAANLFIKSLSFAQQSFYALESKNFTSNFVQYKQPNKLNFKWAMIIIFNFLLLFLIEKTIESGFL